MNLSRLKRKVAELPQEAGVYFFRGKKGELLYIGKATNLRTRVASYFSTDSKLRNQYESTNKDVDNVNLQIEQLEWLQHLQQLERSVVPGRSEWIGSMMPLVEEIEFEQTDSVLEALILESNLIKKHQPKYNTLEKDDKSFAYFVITKEEFPKVLIVRKTDIPDTKIQTDAKLRMKYESTNKIQNTKYQIRYAKKFGPYTSKQQMQIALKIMRRIFPFHGGKQKTEKGCLDFQLGLCPGPYAGAISKEDYKKNIDGIKMILSGKKKRLLSGLEKEMKVLAKQNEFEKAAQVRNKIFALQHIRDVALITREVEHGTWNNNQKTIFNNQEEKEDELSLRGSTLPKQSRTLQGSGSPQIFEYENLRDDNSLKSKSYNLTPVRVEAYDISNISGTDAVGSMVVFSVRGGNWQPNKSEYRKFKIKTVEGSNDVAMMKEVLLRRFSHSLAGLEYQTSSPDGRGAVMKKTLKGDWAMPDLILLDGGTGHVNMAEKLLRQELGLEVAIVGVAKGPTRKNLKLQMANSKQNTIYNIQNTLEINSQNLDDDIRYILQDKLLIKQIMDEAHRFAITFHRKLRGKNALR